MLVSRDAASPDIGKWIETVVPQSGPSLSTSTLPPLALMKALAIHRPRPEPDVVAAWRAPRKKRPPTNSFY